MRKSHFSDRSQFAVLGNIRVSREAKERLDLEAQNQSRMTVARATYGSVLNHLILSHLPPASETLAKSRKLKAV
jgi:hypothetical protein